MPALVTQSHLQAVSLKITAAKSMDSMAHAMAGATKAMGAMNRQFNLPALRGIMMEFEKQNNKMEQTQDMMDDVFDDEGAPRLACREWGWLPTGAGRASPCMTADPVARACRRGGGGERRDREAGVGRAEHQPDHAARQRAPGGC